MSANERDGARRSATERDGARSAQRGARGDPTSRPIQAFKHHRSQDRLTYCAAFSNLGVGVIGGFGGGVSLAEPLLPASSLTRNTRNTREAFSKSIEILEIEILEIKRLPCCLLL